MTLDEQIQAAQKSIAELTERIQIDRDALENWREHLNDLNELKLEKSLAGVE